jgi:hypothetical protein
MGFSPIVGFLFFVLFAFFCGYPSSSLSDVAMANSD